MTSQADERARRAADGLLVLLFVVALVLPVADLATEGALDPALPLVENRVLAERPSWSWDVALGRSFTGPFEDWFDDHFGFRTTLLRWNAALHLFGLGVSVSPSVAVGEEGWLFLTDLAAEYHRSESLFTPTELERWRVMLEARAAWVAERGGEFLFVLAPNKHSVHGEYLPGSLARRGGVSRADQLLSHLRERSDVPYLDLRATLEAATEDGPIYYATDSHWNLRGARLAYETILGELATLWPVLAPVGDEAFPPGPLMGPGGDLARMLGVEHLVTEHDRSGEVLTKRWRRTEELVVPGVPLGSVNRANTYVTEVADARLPSAVILRDSFMNTLAPLLSNHFRRALYVDVDGRLPFPWELIERERPELVLTVMVERMLQGPSIPAPADALRARADRRLRAARPLLDVDLSGDGLIVTDARCWREDGDLVLASSSGGPQLVLPACDPVEGGRTVVTVEGMASTDSLLALRPLAGAAGGGPAPVRSVQSLGDGGRQILELPSTGSQPAVLLRLGEESGGYRLTTLDVTAERVLGDALTDELEIVGADGTVSDAGLELVAHGQDPQLLVPARSAGPGEELVLVADVTLAKDGQLQVFWSEEGAPGHHASRQLAVGLSAGRHALRLPLPVGQISGRLRVDPGRADATVHRLELVGRRALWSLPSHPTQPLAVLGSVVSLEGGELVVDAPGGDLQLLLPPVEASADEQVLLALDVTLPGATQLLAFTLGPGEQRHSTQHRRAVAVAGGRQQLVIGLPVRALSGSVRLDPGALAGRYVIHGLALRAATR
jgi:alginate O-acetyltransferase complex protein AlgJ